MKPFEDLTYEGRIRRIRRLAQIALNSYGFANTSIKFLRQTDNTLFRINEANPTILIKNNLYVPGQYLLRIHETDNKEPKELELELVCLASMTREAHLPVPEPVLTLDGQLFTRVSLPEIPGERLCSLLRWVKGHELKREEIQPHHYKALGQLMAKLHDYSVHWQPPASLSKREYDWCGLFGKGGEDGTPSSESWSLLPLEYVGPFKIVVERVKQVMDQWGKSPDYYGLIHGDLGMEANVLFWDGEARIIDFDDSGLGYYVFDLAIVLEDSLEHQIQPRFKDALLDGYNHVRPLSEDQMNNIDLFLAAYAVFWSLYAADVVRYHPEDQKEIFERMLRYFRLVENFLAKN